ncbi:MAG: transposase [Deltaproteobacteria bacterium]|nr:MAG: transposase [Deltaproteobacteria bacterium]
MPANIRLIWQPPYSPQCNPVENIWDEIREKWFPIQFSEVCKLLRIP